ncbi:MAG TPA: DNA cytosine methyltransferase [Nitrospirales bacterium]|nr:DNA cytosine methyltransferase [Nitrospirales bacterium]
MKRMLDLFSGLKGASQAFSDDESWEVVTVDINPDMEPDIVCDLTVWQSKLFDLGEFDLIWASPPCIEFFRVLAPWCDEYGEPPDLALVNAAMEIISWYQPKTWVIENTESGHRFIDGVLGGYRQKLGPFYMWGNFPLLANVKIPRDHKSQNDVWSTNPMRSAIKAKVPLEISQGLMDAINGQCTLF